MSFANKFRIAIRVPEVFYVLRGHESCEPENFIAEEELIKWDNSSTNNSLTIIRSAPLFGKGGRGEVYNLFEQIAKRRFLMIGNGKNKKSIAYVKNCAAFLEYCIDSKVKPGLYNYSDTPTLDMNNLVKIKNN